MTIKNKAAAISIAHINDTHSYFEPTSLQLTLPLAQGEVRPYVSAGGFARIATRSQQLRAEAERQGKEFLFLHAGDCFQGTLYFSLFKGEANATLLNTLQLDAMTLGNHELDIGNEPVGEFVRRINFPFLAGNWNLSSEQKTKAFPLANCENVKRYDVTTGAAEYIIKDVKGEPIAIFGLSIDKMADIANPDSDTPFENAIKTAQRTVEVLHQQGINKIILLSHLGYEPDKELAEQVNGIGLIIGAHSHVLQGDFENLGLGKEDAYGIKIGDSYIVQAGCHALAMGHCEVDFDEHGQVVSFSGQNELLFGRRMFLDSTLTDTHDEHVYQDACNYIDAQPNVVVCKKDQNVYQILNEKYRSQVKALQQKVIAVSERARRHVRLPDEQGSSEVAPLVAQSFYTSLNQRGIELDFAIHNAGGVRTSLDQGPITVADVAGKLLPFVVPIGHYRIQGKHIAEALEGAINNATNNGVEGTGAGSYPYCYNLRFDYIATHPKGQRIQGLSVFKAGAWQTVAPEAWYNGTSSAYTMKGKEGFEAMLQMQGEGHVTQLTMADCFIELLTEQPDILSEVPSIHSRA